MADSSAATPANAQQLPQSPWSRTVPNVLRQSTADGIVRLNEREADHEAWSFSRTGTKSSNRVTRRAENVSHAVWFTVVHADHCDNEGVTNTIQAIKH